MRRCLCSVVFALLLCKPAFSALACTCSLLPDPADARKLVEKPNRLFFVGEVIEINEFKVHVQSTNRDVVLTGWVTFQISKSWKEDKRTTIKLTTGGGSGDCGYRFVKGEKYLVDAFGTKREYETQICTLTSKLADATQTIAELDQWQRERKKKK